jgi:D-tyrosyl-tRNA(Tyr) deacylase
MIIQRVNQATLSINNAEYSSIKAGLVILVGVEEEDNQEDISWLVKKVSNMRIFSDENQKMNLSLLDIQGEALVVSQFTLFASYKKGNRPSFIRSAKPDLAKTIYLQVVEAFENTLGKGNVATGVFAANMNINLENNGPVTLFLDSKNRE